MSLRTRIALALFAAVVLFAGLDLGLRQMGFAKRFDRLETARAEQQFERFMAALDARFEGLCESAREPLESVHRVEPGGIGSGSGESDFAAVFDADGDRVAGEAFTGADAGAVQAVLTQGCWLMLQPQHPLRQELDEFGTAQTLWRAGGDLWMLGAARLQLPGGEVGYGVRGLPFGVDVAESLRNESLTFTQAHDALSADPRVQEQVATLVDSGGGRVEGSGGNALRRLELLRDANGAPALLLELQVPRELGLELGGLWSDMRRDALFSALALALLFPLVILLVLQAIVTGPLSRLTRHAAEIGRSDDTELRLGLERSDEIGQLAQEFDAMLEKLSRSREEVISTARMAGIAEISAGVMHNIGNALNSVSVSASLADTRLASVRPERLRVIQTELEEHRGDLDRYLAEDPRGKKLFELLDALIHSAEVGVSTSRSEVEALTAGLDRIAALVASLERTREHRELVQSVDLEALLDEVAELCVRSTGAENVDLVCVYEPLDRLRLDRQKLLQATSHVVRNGFEAVMGSGATEPRITLRLRQEQAGGVCIEVEDNGAGIEPGRLESIFALGTSGRPDGSGLGLHLAATAIAELGGEIEATSAGLGRGACFRIRLPRAEAAAAAA